MLNRTCDFCYKRKRQCDGLGEKFCSFCAAKNQAECHYRRRRARSRPPVTSASHSDFPSSASSACRKPGYYDDDARARARLSPPPSTGRSFWRAGVDKATTAAGGGGAAAAALPSGRVPLAAASSGAAGDGRVPGLPLPLKRVRFSASPATGLIGLQESEFLGDFFDCLGFLAIATQSTVCDAMVSIMIAGGSPPCASHHHNSETPSPGCGQGLFGEDYDVTRRRDGGETNAKVDNGCWSMAAERGTRELPRDSSTCILWCAIALGALVRGRPFAQVGRYAGLAEDSLRACRDDATLETARAYVATAILQNFLGDQVSGHAYLQLANSIVDKLPPENIPAGCHGLLQYAGMASTLEPELASVEDVKGYWENADPVWELSERVVERDICCLVLSVSVRTTQPFVDETCANRVGFPEELPPPPTAAEPMDSRMDVEQRDMEELTVRESAGALSATTARVEEGDGICLDNVLAFAEMHKSLLPEMLRVQEWFQSSKMDLGVGGLLYYGALAYLQALNHESATASFSRCVDVMLRYPGLCRYKSWSRIAHTNLYVLALTQRRSKYEEMRASYNSVQPFGAKPAPPYEECRRMSDICDDAQCRKAAARVVTMLGELSKGTAP